MSGASSGGLVTPFTNVLNGSMSTNTLMIIGVVLLALVIGLILYFRSGGADPKSRRAEEIRKELELRRELEALEK